MKIPNEASDEQQSPTDSEVEQWFESEEETENEVVPFISTVNVEQKYAESQLRIVRTSLDFTLHSLAHSLKDRTYVNLSPIYQRRTRWDRKRRSQLIESFLMNIPVPPIFLFENSYNQYEVMDGRQRLETIRDFLDSKFALTGLEFWTELNNRRFGDLNLTLQRGLLRRSITAIVLLAETTRPDELIDVRMVLFRRLNTGGATLNPQEMRNALYPGRFNDMLIELSRSERFTRIWKIPGVTIDEVETPPPELLKNSLYKNMADCELVLRFFAIKETVEAHLRGSIKGILDSCMQRHFSDDANAVERHQALFEQCLRGLDELFNGAPFVLPTTKRPSRPLYDAMMVAYSLNPDVDIVTRKAEIVGRVQAALTNPEAYEVLIGRGNTVDSIRDRVWLAMELLKGRS